MAWVSTTYASRSVRRNLRRTALSVAGIAIGCVLALFMESMNRGRSELFARAGANSGVGHLRVVPDGWRARRDARLRLAAWEHDLAEARSMPEVEFATARSRAQVLLAIGTHVVPVELVGVQPDVEPHTFRYVQMVRAGRYLRAGETGRIVLGRALAERLTAEIDDDIVATTVGPEGDIHSSLFRLAGIADTGNDDSDSAVCQVALEDVQQLSGFSGAGEISIVLRDFRQIDAIRARLAGRVAPGDDVMTLTEMAPEIEGHFKQDQAVTRFVSAIILLIVLLGVASAQLAAVLERRREFAVLAALGMSGPRLVGLVVQEAVMLGAGGAAVATAAGIPIVWAFARHGIDFGRFLGGAYSFQGVLFDPIIYGDFGWWIVAYVTAVSLGATTLASLYPAWFAARTDPAVALRVAQ